MINTYQTSMAPPPVPPRHSRSHSVLIPAPLPSQQGHSKSLVRFLVGVVLLHLFLSLAGFFYLYHNYNMLSFKLPYDEGKTALLSSEKQETSYKTLARMVAEKSTSYHQSALGYIQWDIDHSIRRNINYYHKSWLTILEPGDYYVYSRVTFSKGLNKKPLVSMVKLRKNETKKENTVMQAYCNLNSDSGSASIPVLCTATQGEVMTLEKGNQLSVWVENLSLVNYEDGATTFGMYKL